MRTAGIAGSVFSLDSTRSKDAGVAVWPVRAYAIEELQRMELNGTKIPEAQWRPPIVLENPEYWKLMLTPPAAKSEQPRTGQSYQWAPRRSQRARAASAAAFNSCWATA